MLALLLLCAALAAKAAKPVPFSADPGPTFPGDYPFVNRSSSSLFLSAGFTSDMVLKRQGRRLRARAPCTGSTGRGRCCGGPDREGDPAERRRRPPRCVAGRGVGGAGGERQGWDALPPDVLQPEPHVRRRPRLDRRCTVLPDRLHPRHGDRHLRAVRRRLRRVPETGLQPQVPGLAEVQPVRRVLVSGARGGWRRRRRQLLRAWVLLRRRHP